VDGVKIAETPQRPMMVFIAVREDKLSAAAVQTCSKRGYW